jgi:ABC-type amino acid transport substrate-binding protein
MSRKSLSFKLASILSLIALAFSIFAIVQSSNVRNPTSQYSALDKIQQNRVMRVGYVQFAPCAAVNPESGKLEGIFVDAINEIANDLKLKVEFKETTLATFSSALRAEEFDYSIGPTFITPTRAQEVDFTKPILALGNSGLVKKERLQDFSNLSALSQPNLKIAVLQGQAMEQYVRSNFPKAKLLVIAGSDLTTPLSAVEAGQADIGLSNSITVQTYASKHAGTLPVFTENSSISRLALAWVVKKDDVKLQSFLNSTIDWLVQSGKLELIQSKYPVKLSQLK